MVSAGAGQNDHLPEIISHILEPIVKMRPNGMEVTSTGELVSRIEGINKMVIPIEDVDLADIDDQMDKMEAETLREIDEHLETQERNAQEVYERFDTELAKEIVMDEQENLPEGWNMKYNMHDKFTKSKEIPEGLKIKTNERQRCSTGMESNASRL